MIWLHTLRDSHSTQLQVPIGRFSGQLLRIHFQLGVNGLYIMVHKNNTSFTTNSFYPEVHANFTAPIHRKSWQGFRFEILKTILFLSTWLTKRPVNILFGYVLCKVLSFTAAGLV